MTEKEKMLAGELYYASDEELTKEHNIAQRILWKFNNSPEENRSEILKELFGSTGENFCIKPNFRCDYGYNIYVGENFFAQLRAIFSKCRSPDASSCIFFRSRAGSIPLEILRRASSRRMRASARLVSG